MDFVTHDGRSGLEESVSARRQVRGKEEALGFRDGGVRPIAKLFEVLHFLDLRVDIVGATLSGGIKGGIMPGLLDMANGHFFRGIWKMIKG